jgi:hypothetical protein
MNPDPERGSLGIVPLKVPADKVMDRIIHLGDITTAKHEWFIQYQAMSNRSI